MMNTTANDHDQSDALNADYLHSAFLVDEDGNEVAITRDMIVDSCNQLASPEVYFTED